MPFIRINSVDCSCLGKLQAELFLKKQTCNQVEKRSVTVDFLTNKYSPNNFLASSKAMEEASIPDIKNKCKYFTDYILPSKYINIL